MKKSELKTGMRVKHRNCEIGIILLDIGVIGYKDGFNFFNSNYYTEDLLHIDSNSANTEKPWDIIEVFEGFRGNSQVLNPQCVGRKIWSRKPQKTVEEIQLQKVMAKIHELTDEANKLKEVIENK